jgi:hypothetical protein
MMKDIGSFSLLGDVIRIKVFNSNISGSSNDIICIENKWNYHVETGNVNDNLTTVNDWVIDRLKEIVEKSSIVTITSDDKLNVQIKEIIFPSYPIHEDYPRWPYDMMEEFLSETLPIKFDMEDMILNLPAESSEWDGRASYRTTNYLLFKFMIMIIFQVLDYYVFECDTSTILPLLVTRKIKIHYSNVNNIYETLQRLSVFDNYDGKKHLISVDMEGHEGKSIHDFDRDWSFYTTKDIISSTLNSTEEPYDHYLKVKFEYVFIILIFTGNLQSC